MEITSTLGVNPQQIYETITRKFTYPGGKGRKRKNDTIFFSNVYDEPTYLTFRIDFDFMCDDCGDDYNDIPHGLLNVVTNDFTGNGDNIIPFPSISASDRKYIINNTSVNDHSRHNEKYSAFNYLYYALGEVERAKMLLKFKMGLYDIVKYCPYYITSISGVNNLMKVVPTNGIRVPKDSGTLTITCNEAIDMRITQIMNLYRKIVWDDVYQRWVLPDIMRYFKMYIYISEVRVFHTAKDPNIPDIDIPGTVPELPVDIPDINLNSFKLFNSSINKVMPTIKLECSMCEFDMSDVMSYINNLSSSKSDEPIKPIIKIHVGNVKEVQSYGLSKDYYIGYGLDSMIDHIYSDEALKKNSHVLKEFLDINGSNDELTMIEKQISEPIRRLGVDVTNTGGALSIPFDYSPFDRDATVLASQLNGIMQNLKSLNPLALLTTSGLRYQDPRSMATSYRGGGILSTILESVLDRGIYQLSRAVGYAIDRGMEYIFGFPLRNGVRVGDVVESRLTGNPIPIINSIKDYVQNNSNNQELKELYNKDNWEGMLKSILEDVSRSAATSGIHDKMIDTVDFILKDDPSGKEIGKRIDFLYGRYLKKLKGTSDEANEDRDKGYREPLILDTEDDKRIHEKVIPKNGYSRKLKGTSDEANEDRDKGYQHPELIDSPYISTANQGYIQNPYSRRLKGTSDEANEDKNRGYRDPLMRRLPFISWANNGYVIDAFDQSLKGLSDEANEDTDRGYTDPLLENPMYQSTANTGEIENIYEDSLKGLSDEANEDKDGGYIEQMIDNPQYVSTAVDRHIKEE